MTDQDLVDAAEIWDIFHEWRADTDPLGLKSYEEIAKIFFQGETCDSNQNSK